LLDRILRHLAATYTITEVGESTFAANDATRLLASPPGWGNLMFGFNILNKAYQELPKLLKETKYKNPDHTSDTSFHRAYDTKLPFFLFLQQDPETIRYFQQSLAAFESPISWTTAVPLAEKLQEADKNAPLFVDIGGGHGSQCAAFRKATEHFPGRVINQDLPETLASAPKNEDVEMMAQNFFEKNQIQGSYPLK
jgi:demethylsterigmatocystin 6-O-methyltransferase